MLAATMVAGMSISAFAEIKSDDTKVGPKKTADFDTQDYGLIGAFLEDDKGDIVKAPNKIDGGDKLYYPILISGDEIDDDKYAGSNDMYFADKASEVKNLKASVKDEVGGKYIDSASIVKKAIYGVKEDTKIYCVEVKMADYFKNEETEVDFNITLKKNGKTEYNSKDDDKSNLFDGTYDLGKDSEMFNLEDGKDKNGKSTPGKDYKNGATATKFKSGELKIEIGKDTKTVQLDEAKTSAGKKEDVTSIFIENDKSIDNAFTFDVKASNQDDLYLELNQDAIKDLAVSNGKADLTFFNFPGKPEFDFTGTATFAVEDEDEDNYFYEVVDGELVESRAKYNKEEGVFELRTNKLGSYVISNKELKVSEGKKRRRCRN